MCCPVSPCTNWLLNITAHGHVQIEASEFAVLLRDEGKPVAAVLMDVYGQVRSNHL